MLKIRATPIDDINTLLIANGEITWDIKNGYLVNTSAYGCKTYYTKEEALEIVHFITEDFLKL